MEWLEEHSTLHMTLKQLKMFSITYQQLNKAFSPHENEWKFSEGRLLEFDTSFPNV